MTEEAKRVDDEARGEESGTRSHGPYRSSAREPKRVASTRYDAIEAVARLVVIAVVLVVFVVAEVYLEAHGSSEGARRFDSGIVLLLGGLFDSARVSVRKFRELRELEAS